MSVRQSYTKQGKLSASVCLFFKYILKYLMANPQANMRNKQFFVRNDKPVRLDKKNLIFDNEQNPYIKITLRKADQST